MTEPLVERSTARVFDPWFSAWVSADVWAVTRAPPGSWQARQHERLRELVNRAAAGSPWWAQRLNDAPAHTRATAELLQSLPVLRKHDLMAHFDAAVTDRDVHLADARAFARCHGGAGGAYLGRYVVWESSGSSGEPGLFVQDMHSLAVGDAMSLLRGPVALLGPAGSFARIALVGAIDGPFASILSLQRQRALNPWVASTTRAFSLLQPIDDLVEQLNDWRPAVLATYPSMAWVLAQQQSGGALKLALQAVWTGGETLSPACRRAVADAFGCPVRNSYGASECLEIGTECEAAAMHLNADWVILEPVDAHGRPVPEGCVGETTLLSNLANHVQPILRYDIGDRVRLVPGSCACGSTLPMIEVQGRCDDVLSLPGADGGTVHLSPLALATVMEDAAGVHDFRIEQGGRSQLRLELYGADGAAQGRRQRAVAVLREFLRGQGVGAHRLTVHHRAHAPERGASGKLARIVRDAQQPQAGRDPTARAATKRAARPPARQRGR